MPDPKSDIKAQAALAREDVVKLFAKQGITVSVVKRDKSGMVRDPKTNRFVTEDKPLAAAHIVGFVERDGEVGITTVDGQKYTQATK